MLPAICARGIYMNHVLWCGLDIRHGHNFFFNYTCKQCDTLYEYILRNLKNQ